MVRQGNSAKGSIKFLRQGVTNENDCRMEMQKKRVPSQVTEKKSVRMITARSKPEIRHHHQRKPDKAAMKCAMSMKVLNATTNFEHKCEELFVADLNNAILVRVVMTEGTGEGLECDAQLNEVIKENRATAGTVKLAHEDFVELVTETVAKGGQGLLHLVAINVARVVAVEASKAVEPVSDVLPEMLELLKSDCSTTIAVKHSDHETNCFGIERLPCSIRKSTGEFGGVDLPRAILVDLGEDIAEPSVVGHLVVGHCGEWREEV